MTDITQLFSFLMPDKAAEEAIAGADPFLPLKQAPDLISQLVLKESGNQDYSTSDKIIAGLLSGLGSGYLGKLSSNYQTEKLADYTSLLPGMASGTVTGKPENMSQDVFNIAQKKANQYDIFQKLQTEEDEREFRSQLKSDLVDTYLKDDLLDNREAAGQALKNIFKLDMEGGADDSIGAAPPGTVTPRERLRQKIEETGSISLGKQAYNQENTESMKERGFNEEYLKGRQIVSDVYDEAKKVTRTAGTVPGVDYFTEAGATLGGVQGVVMGVLQQMAKGNPSDKENAVLQNNQPKFYDSPERVEIKKQKMLAFLDLASKGTPYLSAMQQAGMDLDMGNIGPNGVINKGDGNVSTARSDQEPARQSTIETRILKDGSTVRVQRQSDGSYVEVQ